jgi:hypothetical protein
MIEIKLKLESDDVGRIVEDLAAMNARAEEKDEVLQPITRSILHEIVRKAQKKAVRMVQVGSEFSEVCQEMAELLEERDGNARQ